MAKRVLICDDAAFIRMMLKDILSRVVMKSWARRKTGREPWNSMPR